MGKIILLLTIFTSCHQAAFCKQWIIFIADAADKNSPIGHAYVSFIKENPIQRQTMLVGCWGFYPKCGVGAFGYVESEFRDDLKRAKDISLTVEVDDAEFDACLATKNQWEGKKYKLTAQNCLDFLKAVTGNISRIVQPENTLLLKIPANYLEKLKSLNKAIDYQFPTANNSPKQSTPINSSIITKYNDKEFIWLTVDKLPNEYQQQLKNEKRFMDYKDKYEEIVKTNGRVALCDLDDNGIIGIITRNCDKNVCTIEVFENYSTSYIYTQSSSAKPYLDGVLTDEGHMPLIEKTELEDKELWKKIPAPNPRTIEQIITPSNSKYFIWTSWKKMPASVKEQLKSVRLGKQTAYEKVMIDYIKMEAQVFVALYDFDGDGKIGYVLNPVGNIFGGSHGNNYDVFESDGKKGLFITDYGIRPAKDGVLSSRLNKFFPLKSGRAFILE